MIEKKFSQIFAIYFGCVLLAYLIAYNFFTLSFASVNYSDLIGVNTFPNKNYFILLLIFSLVISFLGYLKNKEFSFNKKIVIYYLPILFLLLALYKLNIPFYGRFIQVFLFSVAVSLYAWLSFNQYFKIKINKYFPYFVILLFAIFYSIMSISVHTHFQSHAMDFGLYVQAFYNYANFHLGPSTIKGAYYLLGDHFILLFPFLSPIYRLFPFPQTVLIIQSIFVCAGSIPIYLLGRRILKNDFSALAISIAYLLFIGLQSALAFGIHGATFIPTFFAFAFLFLYERKFIWYWLFVFLALISKEDAPILILFLGIFSVIFTKEKKVGITTALLGLLWYLAVTKFVIPAFNQSGKFDYFQYGVLGKTPSEAIKTIITNPFFVIENLFSYITRMDTILKYFVSFGFLTLLAPEIVLFLGFPLLVEQLLNDSILRWGINFHYSIAIAPVLAIGAIIGILRLTNLSNFISSKYKINFGNNIAALFALIIVVSSISITVWQRSPILTIFKKNTYIIPSWARDINEAISIIPKDASVSAQHSIVPHLANRAMIYQRPLENTKDALTAEYYVLSLYGSTWPLDEKQQFDQIYNLLNDENNYGLIKQVNGTFVFKLNYKDLEKTTKALDYLNNFEN
ncbi:MAG: DUF2079 domain-containing protein [Patescibacteria group bacterium]